MRKDVTLRELRWALVWHNTVRFLIAAMLVVTTILWLCPAEYSKYIAFACAMVFYLLESLYIRARVIELERAVSLYDTLEHNPYNVWACRVRCEVRSALCGTEGRRRVFRYAESRLGPAAVTISAMEGQLYGWQWVKALFMPGLPK